MDQDFRDVVGNFVDLFPLGFRKFFYKVLA